MYIFYGDSLSISQRPRIQQSYNFSTASDEIPENISKQIMWIQ